MLERKLVNVLLLNAIDKISTQNVFTIPTAVLSTLAGRGASKNLDSLKAALETIASTRIEFNVLETEQQPAHWRFSQMLGGAEIKSGICQFRFFVVGGAAFVLWRLLLGGKRGRTLCAGRRGAMESR
ncbi:hypothetical protein SB783_31440 [Paraburkholderia sp. SIMBA_009]